MKRAIILSVLVFTTVSLWAQGGAATETPIPTPVATKEKTAFQTGSVWMPQIDVRADIAIIYGVSEHGPVSFEDRVKSWRSRGYKVHFMTGIAWGQYDDYFLGKWDGRNHLGEGQVTVKGDTIWHGHNIPYVVPVASFIEYHYCPIKI